MPAEIRFRIATLADIPAIVAMLADDMLGKAREVVSDPPDAAYLGAFEAIAADPNQRLVVADRGGRVVGCLQLTFIPGISHRGMWRGQIESVRVASTERGAGIGHALIEHAITLCRERGCGQIQLTSDKSRHEARRFYESMGFVASHEGMKFKL